MHLFAVLPAEHRHDISPKLVLRARQLALEWQAYVVRSHALRKVFVSVKGYYYQADVQGQAVTWLVPHATGQVLPEDVDYRVMLTFLEFYVVMLAFVNYKLFHAVGCRYPPPTDAHLDKAAAGVWCRCTRVSHHVTPGFSALLLDDLPDAAGEPLSAESEAAGSLFKGLVFFLGCASITSLAAYPRITQAGGPARAAAVCDPQLWGHRGVGGRGLPHRPRLDDHHAPGAQHVG